jgi:hypothetical protein
LFESFLVSDKAYFYFFKNFQSMVKIVPHVRCTGEVEQCSRVRILDEVGDQTHKGLDHKDARRRKRKKNKKRR